MRSTDRNNPSREDVLMDFATRQDRQEVLESFVRRYPQYEDELVELAGELALLEVDPAPECAAVDEAVAGAALAQFLQIEARLAAEQALPEPPADPFATLDPRGFRQTAQAFGANVVFMGRLRDRLIRSEELSRGFITRLAEVLGTTADALAAFLAGPPRLPAQALYKADGKPEARDKWTFAQALDGSNLTDEQKRHLASL